MALALFTAVLSLQLFVPPVVGLANNADFAKVIGVFSLGGTTDDEYKFVTLSYNFDPKYKSWWGFISTEQVLTAIAIGLSSLVSKRGTVDIRAIGAVHLALYVIGFYLIQPLLRKVGSPLVRVLVYGLIIAVFGDVAYVSWFNSFYMDVSAFLFLMLSIVFYLRALAWSRRVDHAAFLAASILFAGSKTAHCALALPVAALVLLSGSALGGAPFRIVGALAIVAVAAVTGLVTPRSYAPTGLFTVVFYELLPHSKNSGNDLKELGLDDSYQKWIGSHAFSDGNPMGDAQFVRTFSSRTSYIRVAYFLAKHPSLAYRGVRDSLDAAGRQRPAMGNFPRIVGQPEFSESHAFGVWSGLKRRIFENKGTVYAVYFMVIGCALCITLAWRSRYLLPGGLCISAMASLALGIGAFADAVEVTRHFFMFNAILDVEFVSLLIVLMPSSCVKSAVKVDQNPNM